MPVEDDATEVLLRRAGSGDRLAVEQLLARHRTRLRRMVKARMDPRVAARFDPSDVVQEALLEASRKLADYLHKRPVPFYPWLRQIAWDKLVDLQRRHIHAKRRSVLREEFVELPDHSAMELARRLTQSSSSPSGRLMRAELRERVRAALAELAPADREVLVLRYLEGLSTPEIAAILRVSQRTVQSRHRLALERLHQILGEWHQAET